jgi:leucine dehydrogenase
MFRTGFSGAKVVVNSVHSDLRMIKRKSLMEDTAVALRALEGAVYTGCDLNTNDEDMDYLVEATSDQYVLAGRNSLIDTNVATASSVIGSILGAVKAMEGSEDIRHLTFTVQGCGKVGSTVAKELVKLGAKCIYTCDLRKSAAVIEGCIPIDDWTTSACDVLVPCANSLSITQEIARNFSDKLKYCVGATNSPFADNISQKTFEQRDVLHIPESISSAGAIKADSVEVRSYFASSEYIYL